MKKFSKHIVIHILMLSILTMTIGVNVVYHYCSMNGSISLDIFHQTCLCEDNDICGCSQEISNESICNNCDSDEEHTPNNLHVAFDNQEHRCCNEFEDFKSENPEFNITDYFKLRISKSLIIKFDDLFESLENKIEALNKSINDKISQIGDTVRNFILRFIHTIIVANQGDKPLS